MFGTDEVDITDVIICNIVVQQAVGESAARAILSSIRTICGKAFGQLPQLAYEPAATAQIVAKAKKVKVTQPKYTIPVDLGGGEECMWMQIVADNEAVEHLQNTSGRKIKVIRDTAAVLKRHDSISRSDCESKHSHSDFAETRAYSREGVLQEQELVSDRLRGVIEGEGGWLEHNYRDPKDPLKKGVYSSTIVMQPLRVRLLVDSKVPWLATAQRVAYLCAVRQTRRYYLCLEARNEAQKMAKGHTWVFVTSNRVDGILAPLKPSSIAAIVKKYAERGGVGVGNNNENPGAKENTKVAGHFLRGHAGSVAYTLATEAGATWDPMTCINRARHTLPSFFKNYFRGVVRRLRVAFDKHPHKTQLRFEEAARL